jgi:hypothetical protein
MTQATEIAYITLKPGVDIEGPGPAGEAWKEAISTLQRTEGYQRCYYGRTMENSDILMLIIGKPRP